MSPKDQLENKLRKAKALFFAVSEVRTEMFEALPLPLVIICTVFSNPLPSSPRDPDNRRFIRCCLQAGVCPSTSRPLLPLEVLESLLLLTNHGSFIYRAVDKSCYS